MFASLTVTDETVWEMCDTLQEALLILGGPLMHPAEKKEAPKDVLEQEPEVVDTIPSSHAPLCQRSHGRKRALLILLIKK